MGVLFIENIGEVLEDCYTECSEGLLRASLDGCQEVAYCSKSIQLTLKFGHHIWLLQCESMEYISSYFHHIQLLVP